MLKKLTTAITNYYYFLKGKINSSLKIRHA